MCVCVCVCTYKDMVEFKLRLRIVLKLGIVHFEMVGNCLHEVNLVHSYSGVCELFS